MCVLITSAGCVTKDAIAPEKMLQRRTVLGGRKDWPKAATGSREEGMMVVEMGKEGMEMGKEGMEMGKEGMEMGKEGMEMGKERGEDDGSGDG